MPLESVELFEKIKQSDIVMIGPKGVKGSNIIKAGLFVPKEKVDKRTTTIHVL